MIIFNNGGIHQTALYWFFFYPPLAILLKGNKKGFPWIFTLISFLVVYYLLVYFGIETTTYPDIMLLALIIAMILESAVIFYYELIRKKFESIIVVQNLKLSRYHELLEKQVAQAVGENRDLNQELIDIQKDIIFTMGSIGESRSLETANHVKRVAEYTKLFGLKLGLDESECEMLSQASPMHDIGKVAIPDHILNKPGRLTDQEYIIMQNHPTIGYEMLKNSNRSLLKMAATIAYEHHEKWDGSGYPNGLKGEEIHIYGRITAIADVFDALSFERVYKPAWSDERIFELLKQERGTHFDPQLVDIFFEHAEDFLNIREVFANE